MLIIDIGFAYLFKVFRSLFLNINYNTCGKPTSFRGGMDSTSLSLIIILYSRQGYGKKVFLIPNVEERFKQIVKYICDDMDTIIIARECDKDYIPMFLNCPPILR